MNRTFLSLLFVATLPAAIACSSTGTDGTTQQDASADATQKTDSGSTPVVDSGNTPAEDSGDTTADSGGEPGDAGTGGDVGAGNPGPDAAVTLSFNTDVYTPILSKRCIGCHGPTADGGAGSGISSGKLDLGTEPNAYTNLVGAPAAGKACATLGGQGLVRVKPGDPNTSLLYNKLASNDGDGGIILLADGGPSVLCGNPMPLHGHALAAADLGTIHDWIQQGATP